MVIGILGVLSVGGYLLEYRVNPSDLCPISMVQPQPGGTSGPTLLLIQGDQTYEPCGRVFLATALLLFGVVFAGPIAMVLGAIRIIYWIRGDRARANGLMAFAAVLLGAGCWLGFWGALAMAKR